jgi:hypothetical protein
MGTPGMAHGSYSSRPMPEQHLQQQPQQPGASAPAHLAMYPNMGMNMPQNGLQPNPHPGAPLYNNLNGPPQYMMPGGMLQNRHMGAGQPIPAAQPQALPGPQAFPHQGAHVLPSPGRQVPGRGRSAQAAAMLRNTTALRASAREFVPGNIKPAPPAPQLCECPSLA